VVAAQFTSKGERQMKGERMTTAAPDGEPLATPEGPSAGGVSATGDPAQAHNGPATNGASATSDPMRHHQHYVDSSPYAGGSSFMERVSEGVASGMGTVGFLVVSSAVIVGWVLSNHVITFLGNSWKGLLNGHGFDPAPFILLNLVFSAVAFYTGALVIIAQKAQTRTDKASEEASAEHREELARFQIELLEKNTNLTEQIHTLTERLSELTQEVHSATCKGLLQPEA
jgi:uncharacterized membrane protein